MDKIYKIIEKHTGVSVENVGHFALDSMIAGIVEKHFDDLKAGGKVVSLEKEVEPETETTAKSNLSGFVYAIKNAQVISCDRDSVEISGDLYHNKNNPNGIGIKANLIVKKLEYINGGLVANGDTNPTFLSFTPSEAKTFLNRFNKTFEKIPEVGNGYHTFTFNINKGRIIAKDVGLPARYLDAAFESDGKYVVIVDSNARDVDFKRLTMFADGVVHNGKVLK